MKIAQYRYETGGGYVCIHQSSVEATTSAVRISEYLDVEFPPRDAAEVEVERRERIAFERAKLEARLKALDTFPPQTATS